MNGGTRSGRVHWWICLTIFPLPSNPEWLGGMCPNPAQFRPHDRDGQPAWSTENMRNPGRMPGTGGSWTSNSPIFASVGQQLNFGMKPGPQEAPRVLDLLAFPMAKPCTSSASGAACAADWVLPLKSAWGCIRIIGDAVGGPFGSTGWPAPCQTCGTTSMAAGCDTPICWA